jgi:hypothetical protein
MAAALQHDTRTTQITEMTLSSAKKVGCPRMAILPILICAVCVSDALVAEIKRIVKDSEILKYVQPCSPSLSTNRLTNVIGKMTQSGHKRTRTAVKS